jgi:membrane protein DedA with SNARE-associated domain
MWEEILKAVSGVYFPCMIKFIFGPLAGYGLKLNLATTILSTVAGMMTVVTLLTFAGDWIKRVFKRFFSRKQKNTERDNRFGGIWRRYGVAGVAFLTPIILTPIGGTLLAISLGSPKDKLLFYMFISASFWASVFSMAIYLFGNNVFPDYIK